MYAGDSRSEIGSSNENPDFNENRATFKQKSNQGVLILAVLVSIVCLVAINAAVIHFFFGSIARTGKNLERSLEASSEASVELAII